MMAMAFVTAAYLLHLELKRKRPLFTPVEGKDANGKITLTYPDERVGDITIVAAISGLLGAKIFAILESGKNIQQFLADPIGNFFTGSGLAIYGGLIGGFIACLIFIRRYLRINPLHVMDAVAPALIVAYAIGRIGCQLSGDGDWGIPNPNPEPTWWFLPHWLWAFDYPRNVMGEGVQIADMVSGRYRFHLQPSVYPTPVYETIMGLAIGAFLWAIRKRVHIAGMLFMYYMILNGVERFFIEKIRVNDKIHAFGLTFTQAEFIAVCFVVIGVAGVVILRAQQKKTSDLQQP